MWVVVVLRFDEACVSYNVELDVDDASWVGVWEVVGLSVPSYLCV